MTVVVRNTEDILKTIPHREPFLFLDEIKNIQIGKYLRGVMKNEGRELFYKGHFPSIAIMPGVLIIEALAQAACYLFVKTINPPPNSMFYMGSVKMRFFKHAGPKDIIELLIKGEKIISTGAVFSVKAISNETILTSGQLGLICKYDRK